MKKFLEVSTKGHYGLALMAHLAGKYKSGRFTPPPKIYRHKPIKDFSNKLNEKKGYRRRESVVGGFISLKEIGESENISAGYLEEIAAILKKKNLVISHKGKNGGYKLSKIPDKIKILDIIEALEGPLALVDCLGIDKNFTCINKNCASKNIWRAVQNQLYKNLNNIKLGEFILSPFARKPRGLGLLRRSSFGYEGRTTGMRAKGDVPKSPAGRRRDEKATGDEEKKRLFIDTLRLCRREAS